MRVLEVINKARLQLTSNDEADLTIEELFGEDDYESSLSRDTFNQIMDDNNITE